MTANEFIIKLSKFKSKKEIYKVEKLFNKYDSTTRALGIRFGDIFRTAKEFSEMNLSEIDKLLDSEFYEIRMGAVSIMDFQAKSKKTSEIRKEKLFNLYISRHDRLNNWGFVDRGAYNIIGEYLINRPRDVLYELAKSEDVWRRRTAIVSTYAFIKRGEIDDTFNIAEILINDKEEFVNKAVGSWIREAGKKNQQKLIIFLDKYAMTMPRVTLRYAIEKLPKQTKEYYLNLYKKG